MPQGEPEEGGSTREIETPTRPLPHYQNSQSKRQRKQDNRHKEVAAAEVAEGEDGEAKQRLKDHRNQMLPLLNSCRRLYNKQRIEVEEVDEAADAVAGVEAVQSDSHSAWPLAAVNLVGN
jgi:hypothetical protein